MSNAAESTCPGILVRSLPEEVAGADAKKVVRHFDSILADFHNSVSITNRELSLQLRFVELAEQWRAQTALESSLHRITENPFYKRIVALGDEVIPLLLRELEKEPDYWFSALRSLTGEDPVALTSRGDVRAMTDAWLNWGRSRGYVP